MITSSCISELGSRKICEDAHIELERNGGHCFAIADGVGGHGGGDIASKAAVNAVKKTFSHSGDLFSVPEASIINAHGDIKVKQDNAHVKNTMMTTMVVAAVTETELCFSWVGDSRLYLFNSKGVLNRTYDHSVPQMLVACGEITEDEIRHHPDRNRILKAVGSDDAINPSVSPVIKLTKPAAILLCTDGFWEPITEKEMLQCLRDSVSSENWLDKMNTVIKKSGCAEDNYTAIGVWVY